MTWGSLKRFCEKEGVIDEAEIFVDTNSGIRHLILPSVDEDLDLILKIDKN